MRRRLTWDILIALSAMENRAVIVTKESDFKKIQKFVDFEYLAVGGKKQMIQFKFTLFYSEKV